MSESDEKIKTMLLAIPGWQNLNAYEMTKRCCDEITKLGGRLPSWMVIREIIGKGSSNDINRGKEDFRREHGESLRKMDGFIKGVPEVLAPHVLGIWTAAIALVRGEFDSQVEEWKSQIEHAEATVVKAEGSRDQAVNRAETLLAQLDGLRGANVTLQGHIDTERAAREQAERMFESNRSELAAQRDDLRTALAGAQQELNGAITRLEGVERRALLEIDRARTEAQNKVASIEAKAKRDSETATLEMARINNQLRDLRAKLAQSEQRTAVLEQANDELRERATRAELQADKLTEGNSRLATSLKQSAAAKSRNKSLLAGRKKITKLR